MTQYTVKYDLTEKEEEALRGVAAMLSAVYSKGRQQTFEKYTLADVFNR